MIPKSKQKRVLEIVSTLIMLSGILTAYFVLPSKKQPLIVLFAFVVMILVYPVFKQLLKGGARIAWHYYVILSFYVAIGLAIIVFMDPSFHTKPLTLKLFSIACGAIVITLSVHWIGKLIGYPVVPSEKE